MGSLLCLSDINIPVAGERPRPQERAFVLLQIYDQIYLENFERARKEEEERAREATLREQQAAWGGPPPGGPSGPQNPGWGADPAGNGWQGGPY